MKTVQIEIQPHQPGNEEIGSEGSFDAVCYLHCAVPFP